MKHAANIKKNVTLCICALAGAVALSGCTGEASYQAAPQLETQSHSLSAAMRAMDECRPILENVDAAMYENVEGSRDPVRDAYGACLDDNGVVPPVDPLRICNVVAERVNFALEQHEVNCGAPHDLLEQTLCDVSIFVNDCGSVVPEPQRPACTDADCSNDPVATPDPGPQPESDFCSDVRVTVEECHQNSEPTSLPQQFPECFDNPDGEGGDGFSPGDDGREGDRDGAGGFEGSSGGESGWGDGGAPSEACEVLRDELSNCSDEENCQSLVELMGEHCAPNGGGGGGW